NQQLAAANTRERAAADDARRAIEDMTSDETLQFLETQKELRQEQRRFLERALAYYRRHVSEAAEDATDWERHSRAYFRMRYLQARLGRNAEAEAAYGQALKEYERLAADHPAVPEDRRDLAGSRTSPGNLLEGLR